LSIRSFVEDRFENVVGISVIHIVYDVESVNEQTRSRERTSLYVSEKTTGPEVDGERLSINVELESSETSSSSSRDLDEVDDSLFGQVKEADVPLVVIGKFSGGRDVHDSASERVFVVTGDGELKTEQVVEGLGGEVVAEERDTAISCISGQVSSSSRSESETDIT